jgi:carboxymethylenebutenolidase
VIPDPVHGSLVSDLRVVSVIDRYRGQVATDHESANHLMTGLDWAGAVADIKGAAMFLRACGCTSVHVLGFCMGGALSLASSITLPDLLTGGMPTNQSTNQSIVSESEESATLMTLCVGVVFYGISSFADPASLKIPLQAHFGDLDDLAGFSDPAVCCASTTGRERERACES